MKGKRRLWRILGAALILLLTMVPAAYAYQYDYEAEEDYTIKSYHVAITVNEDNSFDITEELNCWFDPDAYKHGIIRSIPLTNNVTREDGSITNNRAKVSDVTVSATDYAPYETYTDGGYYKIRIGSGDSYVKGDFTYEISYHYALSRDTETDFDEVYFNIIGTEWDTSIKETKFTVTMPKEFDAETLGFTHGGYGSMDYEGIYYKVDGNTIMGYYDETLPPYNGLTMRLTLPEGYFVYQENIFDKLGGLFQTLPFAGLLGMIWVFLKKGHNPRPAEPVEFYPPDDHNPLEIGYLYDGTLDDKDVTSLLIYLANQGYWKIKEEKGKYTIQLLKAAYEGNNNLEKRFFDGIAKRAKDGVVKESDLEEKFYTTVESIRKSFHNKKIVRSIFEPVSKYKVLGILAGLLLAFISAFMGVYYNTYSTALSFGLAGGAALFAAFYVPFLVLALKQFRNGKVVGFLILAFLTVHFGVASGSSLFVLFRTTELLDQTRAVIAVLGVLAGGVIMMLAASMKKRTPYGNEILGRIRGFRNFLEAAEKPQLEMLVEEDPEYFYRILPYTHVLGVSSLWIKKFDGIAMQPPTWYEYEGTYVYDGARFNAGITRSLDHMSGVLNSQPHSSSDWSGGGWSGGGFSGSSGGGGGFSGGGSGGGGGSSW